MHPLDYDNLEISGYQILGQIGAGGMGQVYRAVHIPSGRSIAIKVMSLKNSSQTALQRFLNEARIQAKLKHPNIVSLYDCLEVNGRLCILMEYVDGQTLTEYIRQSPGLSNQRLLEIFSAVNQAVAYLHRQGVVHRDIKSDNIKISSTGQVKLLDFGISQSEFSKNLTIANGVVGTINYISPEQLQGKKADVRSDIWAMGVLLYEMVTGRLPFDAPTIGSLCELIKRSKYVALGDIAPQAHPTIVRIVTKCLQQKPDNRYASAEQIAKEIKIGMTLLDVIPMVGKSESRHLRHLPVLAVIIISLTIIIIVFNWWWRSEDDADSADSSDLMLTRNSTSINIPVDVKEGVAKVYWNGIYKGKTPLKLSARSGTLFALVLKQDGFEEYQFNGVVTEQTKSACTSIWMKKIKQP